MVISNPDAVAATTNNAGGDASNMAHPSGIPRDRIDNIMSGIANTGDVKMNNHRKKLRQRFDIIKKLGQGTYGKVQLGINKETGQEVAIKTIKKCKIEAEADLVRIRREVQIMSSVQHPNIIHIYEVFENREKMVLVMEFAAGGELYDYLSERKVLNEEEARRIFRQVATAVYYCHKHKICHRDLKLENILLDENGNAKIADFGLSNVFDETNLLSTFCGSPLYASPEIVEGTPYQGPEVDCWSLGVLLYTLVYGSMPFDGSNFKRLVKQISQGDYYEPKKPSRASTLIRDMLTVSPRKRATIEQICAHWWVNENDNVSCLDLAEELATQTPVRLDVLLSLTPAAITADQLVVPSADAGKGERVPRSHSVGSIRDIGGNTEAERRILDMVAAGGEAALMPSPTRTITPTHSPVQSKRKLETTVSTDNAHGAVLKKKEKPGSNSMILGETTAPLATDIPMETEEDDAAQNAIVEEPITPAPQNAKPSHSFSRKDMETVGDLCEHLIQEDNKPAAATATNTAAPLTEPSTPVTPSPVGAARQKTLGKLESLEEAPEEKDATKVIKKFVNKHKTADLVNAIGQITPTSEKTNEPTATATPTSNTKTAIVKPTTNANQANQANQTNPAPFVRKCSLQDESSLSKFNADRRKSRVLETTEKLQQMNAGNGAEKPKKFNLPGVSVGSFKKEFERKATNPPQQQGPTPGELRAMEEMAAAAAEAQELAANEQLAESSTANATPPQAPPSDAGSVETSDSKNSVASLSLDDARRSMENSIALLRQAQSESSKEVDQLCAQTENIEVSETSNPMVAAERERKLKNARAIIGNAIQPVIRRPSQPSIGIGFGGVGGGGYGQMRAASSGFIGFGNNGSGSMSGGMGGGGIGSVNVKFGVGKSGGSNYQTTSPQSWVAYNTNATPQTPPPLLTPKNVNVRTNGNTKTNPNVALAAARQHIMGRLAAAASGDGQNEFQTDLSATAFNYFMQSPTSNYPTPPPPPPPTLFNQFKQNKNNNSNQMNHQQHIQHSQQQHQAQQQQQQQKQQPQQHPHQYQHTQNNATQKATTQTQLLQFQQRLQQLQQQRQRHHQSLIEQQSEFEAQQQQQQYKNEKQAFSQPLLHQYQSKQAHSMSMPNTLAATTSATATAVNVKNTAMPSSSTSTSNATSPIAATMNSVPKPFYNAPPPSIFYKSSPGGDPNNTVKTSTATITLKSATLPRRKPNAKTEIQLEIKPRIVEQPNMRFTTEMQHPVADLRSAPVREGPAPYSPIKTMLNARATSLEPKEHIIPIQRPQAPYARTTSNTTTRSSLSRQSTNDSESDTTTTANMSQSTVTGSSQPIKKSPREFIIPIAMEGGGFITPREGSIEPSESSHTASSRSTFNRLRPTRRIGSSLLNESGIDDSSPFQKFRTSSGNREGDEEPHFTLHRLRSSRPVKKLSQDNDSQSSGEEDDDDGFEILTAENLFSTLLQRVHALTHRMNVDKDLTAGFPNSSRLLGNMRSPFWNKEPFGSRLNTASGNNVGAPWRHSMSRDLSNDMDSIFSRTGATLPRGTKTSNKINRPATIAEPSGIADGAITTTITADEPLDLADLDLSRLRLSKKDLETLSSITPGLPKCFQEQLLAKLPPTQARKLSRTLSMQNSTPNANAKIYKRSQSGGRGVLHTPSAQQVKENVAEETASSSTTSKRSSDSTNERRHYDPVYRRSLSRTRYDYETNIPSPGDAVSKSRSSSVCREEYGKSMCGAYTSDINDRYKYYSPYLNKSTTKDSSTESGSVSPQKRYSGGSMLGRPPSGCLSPPISAPTVDGTSSLRRRSTQKRISRFLRPDFYDEPLDENPFIREKKQREREAQNVLREIRERSREPSRERPNYVSYEGAEPMTRKQSLPNTDSTGIPQKLEPKHVRNKSLEMYADYQPASSSSQETIKQNRRSLSRPREITEERRKNELADKILEELQLLSAARTQKEHERAAMPREVSQERATETTKKALKDGPCSRAEIEENETTSTIKKLKKLKPKEKSNTTESSTDADTTVATTVVKKMKKIVKKGEGNKPALNNAMVVGLATPDDDEALTTLDREQTKRESKLKRPKSYPTKEPTIPVKTEPGALTPKYASKPTTIPEMNAVVPNTNLETTSAQAARESRLVRPKSYPASKLTPPKESSRKVTRSGAAIPTIAESRIREALPPLAVEEKFEHVQTPMPSAHVESSSSSDNKPNTMKKIIKVTKKSKLAQPLPVTPTTSTPTTTSATTTPADNSKESSPVMKEKSPDKKPSKGLLYAIGQKFEKLRDSAMNKEKKNTATSPGAIANGGVVKKRSPDNTSPEKIKEKERVVSLKKKKSLDNLTVKSDKLSAQCVHADGFATTKAQLNDCEFKEKPIKADKRSRIDAMLRSLRERSVPRSRPAVETQYIKRAISVEEMPGTCNKNAVNRVLGLFKRNEKELNGAERRVQSTRSTSNIERQIRETTPSPIYQNTVECQRVGSISAALANNHAAKSNSARKLDITAKCGCAYAPPTTTRVNIEETQCAECMQDVGALTKSKCREEQDIKPPKELLQCNKDKRKGLMLDLTKLDKLDNNTMAPTNQRNNLKAAYINGNGIYSNLPPYPGAVNSSSNNSSSQQSMDNNTNNNNNSYMTNNNSSMQTSQTSGYRTSSTHEINRNHLLTPSTENIANYSSDSRSYQDDCASTSTFLSPTEENELMFDNWSVCSEDNYMLHASPSPTVSRLSRASQLSSPTRGESSDPNESVIDRIKRRSFYCRFNDKKPKRTSSIVGPSAVRDYYREQQTAVKARSSNKLNPNERAKSPDITQEFFRPLKLSPVGTELKPPIYKAPLDYATNITKPRKSLNDIRPTTSPSLISKRYGSTADTDYLTLNSGVPIRYKSSASSSPYESKVASTAGSAGLGLGGVGAAANPSVAGNYYNTYSPKRRSSYTLNGTLPSGATLTNSTLDGYATVGRRPIRNYDHRTMSLLDPTTSANTTSGSGNYKHEARTPVRDYTTGISRSNSRYRTSSATRSPTNI